MVVKTLVKSFYNGMLVTCYEYNGKKYVTNQHGNWDVYEGEYVRGEKVGTVDKNSPEILNIIKEFERQSKS